MSSYHLEIIEKIIEALKSGAKTYSGLSNKIKGIHRQVLGKYLLVLACYDIIKVEIIGNSKVISLTNNWNEKLEKLKQDMPKIEPLL